VPPDYLDGIDLLLIAVNAAMINAMVVGAKQALEEIHSFSKALRLPQLAYRCGKNFFSFFP
jgi:hypothetical protein